MQKAFFQWQFEHIVFSFWPTRSCFMTACLPESIHRWIDLPRLSEDWGPQDPRTATTEPDSFWALFWIPGDFRQNRQIIYVYITLFQTRIGMTRTAIPTSRQYHKNQNIYIIGLLPNIYR